MDHFIPQLFNRYRNIFINAICGWVPLRGVGPNNDWNHTCIVKTYLLYSGSQKMQKFSAVGNPLPCQQKKFLPGLKGAPELLCCHDFWQFNYSAGHAWSSTLLSLSPLVRKIEKKILGNREQDKYTSLCWKCGSRDLLSPLLGAKRKNPLRMRIHWPSPPLNPI